MFYKSKYVEKYGIFKDSILKALSLTHDIAVAPPPQL